MYVIIISVFMVLHFTECESSSYKNILSLKQKGCRMFSTFVLSENHYIPANANC